MPRSLKPVRERPRALWEGVRHRRLFHDVERFVMFIGYPRSGHSLIGELLNAHPDALVANELDAMRYMRAGYGRNDLYARLLARDREYAAGGRRSGEYEYVVPGQWQGRWRTLRVIGDKKGGGTSLRLNQRPHLLDRLRRKVGVPLRIIHIVRNPYDNIATIHRRGAANLERAARRYFMLADTVAEVAARVEPGEWIEMRHEDFVADPVDRLRALCLFVGLEPEVDYLEACASIVRESTHRSRDDYEWSPRLVEDVARRSRELPFLASYLDEALPEKVVA